MTTITPTITPTDTTHANRGYLVQWVGMQNNDIGAPVGTVADGLWEYADRTYQVEGTFGGGSCTVQGSNDQQNYRTLNDPQGVPLVLSTAIIKQLTEVTYLQRPIISGGDGTTSLTVTAFLRRVFRQP